MPRENKSAATIIMHTRPEVTELTTLDRTAWLKMVWTALDEHDTGKQKTLLQNANAFISRVSS